MPPTPRSARALVLATSAVLASGTLVALPHAAGASTNPYPWPPTSLRPTAITDTSFTVTADPSANDQTFRLWASTDYHDVLTSRMNNGPLTAAVRTVDSATPTITMSGLPYSAKTWYYRIEAINGAKHSFTQQTGTLGLLPSTPSGLNVHSGSDGTYLTWDGSESNGYDVQAASDPTMTTGLQNWQVRSVRGAPPQFTPPDLQYGSTYWFRVRAMNSGTTSDWTDPVSVTVQSHLRSVQVMTYNLLTAEYDGKTAQSGLTIAPWSQRAQKAAELLRQAGAEVIGVQEACKPVDGYARQVDELVADANRMGSHYQVADTNTPSAFAYPNHKTGNYIVYDASKYAPVGPGGYWTLDTASPVHGAVWQELRPVDGNGGPFLFVTTHLPVQNGAAGDQQRQDETAATIRYASALAQARGIPVIYSGDFNSHPMFNAHPLDGPQVAMTQAGIVNDATVAPVQVHPDYNSVNEYYRTPGQTRMDIDYLWLPPGVAGSSWRIILRLDSSGQFVGAIPSDHNPVAGLVQYPY